MRDAICDGDVHGFDLLTVFAERHGDDDLFWHIEDVGGGAHVIEVNVTNRDGLLPEEGPYLWLGFLDTEADLDGPWLDGIAAPTHVGGYRYDGFHAEPAARNEDRVVVPVAAQTGEAIADALDTLIGTLSLHGERVSAIAGTAQQCSVCHAWIACGFGPFGENDPTKPMAGALHYVTAHSDHHMSRYTEARYAGRPLIGVPYMRVNEQTVVAVRDTHSVKVEQAAQALAAELREAGVSSVSDYHDVCDANEAIDQHATEVGLTWDGDDLSALNDVTYRCDMILLTEAVAR